MVIGASPDSKVQTQTNPHPYLVEIKWRNDTIIEVCKAKDFCSYLDSNNEIQLKQIHGYYTQIQGQLGVCQYKLCHLVLYTLHSHSGRNPIQCNVLGFTSQKIKKLSTLNFLCHVWNQIKLQKRLQYTEYYLLYDAIVFYFENHIDKTISQVLWLCTVCMAINVTGIQTNNAYCVKQNCFTKDSFQTNPSISIIYQNINIYMHLKISYTYKFKCANIFYAINFLFYIKHIYIYIGQLFKNNANV